MQLVFADKSYALSAPFHLPGKQLLRTDAISLLLTDRDGRTGRGECICDPSSPGDVEHALSLLEGVRSNVEAGAGRREVQGLLPPGPARNALDCAFWELEAKQAGQSIWQFVGLKPRGLTTAFSIGLGAPQEMTAEPKQAQDFRRPKLILDGGQTDARVAAVHAARPDADLILDFKGLWSMQALSDQASGFAQSGVVLIEQPLCREDEMQLAEYTGSVPLCADETLTSAADYPRVSELYHYINIQLDKVGGLTEGLEIVRLAKESGVGLMVGNRFGSSLNIAPHLVIAQFCHYVDLDGPLFLNEDANSAIRFERDAFSEVAYSAWG